MKRHIIIIHEIYGVTNNLLELKHTLEALGFSVSLPSLYEDNYVGTDESSSYKKFYEQVGIEKSYKVINDLIQGHHYSEIILIGFSIGATVAWLHSTNKKVSKVIAIYGSRIRNYLDIEPRVKTYLFFCKEKSFDVEEVHTLLNTRENVSSKIITGEHGFYGKSEYENKLVGELNKKILRIIENS